MSARKSFTGLEAFNEDTSGATAVEFALVAPAFIVLVFGIMQVSFALHCSSSLHFALRAASRSLMLNPDLTEGQLAEQVRTELKVLGDADVEVKMTIAEDASSRAAKIVGTYKPSVVIPLVGALPITYSSTISTALPADYNWEG